jgi:hypothetical protein
MCFKFIYHEGTIKTNDCTKNCNDYLASTLRINSGQVTVSPMLLFQWFNSIFFIYARNCLIGVFSIDMRNSTPFFSSGHSNFCRKSPVLAKKQRNFKFITKQQIKNGFSNVLSWSQFFKSIKTSTWPGFNYSLEWVYRYRSTCNSQTRYSKLLVRKN